MIVDKILKHLSEKELESEGPKIRLSSAGKCARQQAYKYHEFEPNGKEIDSRAHIIFGMGDKVEEYFIQLCKEAGVNITRCGSDQETVTLDIGGYKIEGHPDGELEDAVVEFKSMNTFAFGKFEKGELDESYRAQVMIYMHTKGLKQAVIVAMDKNNQMIAEMVIDYSKVEADNIINDLKTVINSTPDNLPQRKYSPDSKGIYSWQCSYCQFYKTCLVETGMAERILVRNAYKLRAIKQEDQTGFAEHYNDLKNDRA